MKTKVQYLEHLETKMNEYGVQIVPTICQFGEVNRRVETAIFIRTNGFEG